MSYKFGVICEGVTDLAVIENILSSFGYEIINPLFPDVDIKQNPIRSNTTKLEGGWKQLFKYCSSNKFKEALPHNDYLIIQIDTDVDMSNLEKASILNCKSTQEILNDARECFKKIIGDSFFEQVQNKIIFAISVHSIECWLLPIYKSQEEHEHKGCLSILEKYTGKILKNYDVYLKISELYRNLNQLKQLPTQNKSFEKFMNELEFLQQQHYGIWDRYSKETEE